MMKKEVSDVFKFDLDHKKGVIHAGKYGSIDLDKMTLEQAERLEFLGAPFISRKPKNKTKKKEED